MKNIFLGLLAIIFVVTAILLYTKSITEIGTEVVNTQLSNAIMLQHSKELKVLDVSDPKILNEMSIYGLKVTSLIINGQIENHVQSLLNYAPYPGSFKVADSFTNINGIEVTMVEPGVIERDVMLYHLVLFNHREESKHNYSFGFEIKCMDVADESSRKDSPLVFKCNRAKEIAQEIANSVDIFDQSALDDLIDKKVLERQKELEKFKDEARNASIRN